MDKRPANATPCIAGMDADAAEERSATKANAGVKVNKHTHKKKRKDTHTKPQKTSETTGQSQNNSQHMALKEVFPGKLLGSQNFEATPHIQNNASEAEGTTSMLREHKPLSPSEVEFYDRSKASNRIPLYPPNKFRTTSTSSQKL